MTFLVSLKQSVLALDLNLGFSIMTFLVSLKLNNIVNTIIKVLVS